ncbi:unnamed protein product [Heligmosomoides polygyrus]|uniref:Transmembrane protein n=1 Tax=Heligmosomoides polygyrus TaxID=6339 RepID=A0A183F8H6_HELPZ|nr:unnamed protein product [Heligmosomoides polygyrus]
MTRSRLNSETHEETQKSILKNGKGSANLTSMEPSVSASNDGDKPKDTDVPEQTTIHAYEKHQRTADHHPRPHLGTVAMIERQLSKPPASTAVMPTPTSTERKFTDSFYWMSHLHKKVGLSHIILLLILASYSALGAVVFYYLETPNERIVIAARKEVLDDRIEQLAAHLSAVAENKTAEEMALDVKVGFE